MNIRYKLNERDIILATSTVEGKLIDMELETTGSVFSIVNAEDFARYFLGAKLEKLKSYTLYKGGD